MPDAVPLTETEESEKVYEARMKQRIGRFTVSRLLVQRLDPDLKRALDTVFVVRAETMFHNDCIEYVGISKHFKLVDAGARLPFYFAEIGMDGVKWHMAPEGVEPYG